MLFSFIIPTYNYANIIGKAIESILAQEGDDYEVVIVDDGSVDDTRQKVQAFVDQHPETIHYYYQENRGPASTRNKAAQLARGEFIYALDADDTLLPGALNKMRAVIAKDPTLDLVIAGYCGVFSDGRRKLKVPSQLSADRERNFVVHMRKKCFVQNGAHVLRRSVFDRIQYPDNISGREDMVFFSHLLAVCSVGVIEEPVLEMVKHSESLRHQMDKQYGGLKIIDAIFDANKLPQDFFKYKKEYQARLCLSFFRDHYMAKDYKTARQWYYRALKTNPWMVFQWRYFKKYVKSFACQATGWQGSMGG